MITFFYLLGFTVALNVLFYLPVLLRLLHIKRQRGLQDARADIVACSTAFQKYLADKKVTCGQLVHDWYYETINAAQFYDRYIAIIPVLSPKRRIIGQLRRKAYSEMNSLPSEIQEISKRFNAAYLRAAFYRNPFRFHILFGIAILNHIERLIRHRIKGKQEDIHRSLARLPGLFQRPSKWELSNPALKFAAIWFVAIGVASFDHKTQNDSTPIPSPSNAFKIA